MERKLFFITLMGLSIMFFVSCATLFSGARQKVSFNSNPTGASGYVNGQPTGKTTPCEMTLPRKVSPGPKNTRNQYVYEFKKEGYNDYVYYDNRTINGLIYVNLLTTVGIPFIGIDFLSGAAYKYAPTVNAVMSSSNLVVVRDTVVKQQIVYVGSEKKGFEFMHKSDVDKDIPVSNQTNPYKFALIIGNEDYSSHQVDLGSESNVDFARNDASAFREYAVKTLGVPERNVVFLLDATVGQMQQALSKMNLLVKNTNGKAEVLFFYAGHGLPDEATREPYLIPVDVSGKNPALGVKLADAYQKLTEYPNRGVAVFIDACFSGGARNQGLIAARGVKVKPKETPLKGNLIVLTSSSGEQSSMPLKDKEHGLFTYYLLSKIKESKGELTYKELADYVVEKVGLESVLSNDKEQTPMLMISPDMQGSWQAIRLK